MKLGTSQRFVCSSTANCVTHCTRRSNTQTPDNQMLLFRLSLSAPPRADSGSETSNHRWSSFNHIYVGGKCHGRWIFVVMLNICCCCSLFSRWVLRLLSSRAGLAALSPPSSARTHGWSGDPPVLADTYTSNHLITSLLDRYWAIITTRFIIIYIYLLK